MALSAALTPLWIFLVRLSYIAVGGALRLGLAGGTIARLLFSAVVLSVPTVLIGKPSPNVLRDWLARARRILAWEKDGVESSVGVLKGSDGYAFAISGKVDGSSRGDAATQVMGGLVGAALHANPRRALVIGLGTGSTAGWLAAVPSIERVDVVEVEPAILRIAADCAPVNRDVLRNPRVKVSIGDAREWLLTSRDTYDIIFSEPSNPYRAGVSSLFTEDFYRAVRSRLEPGGIFLQWLQAYEVDSETVRTLYATLRTAFPEVETWHSKPNDLLLVSTADPLPHDAAILRERLRQEPFASAMEKAWRAAGLEGFLSHYVARSTLARAIAGNMPTNTDDRNRVELGFARSLGQDSFFSVDEISRVARERREENPLVTGEVDWTAVNRWRAMAATASGATPPVRPGLTVEELRSTLAQRSFFEGRPEAVLANWRAQPWEPRGSVEEVVLAEALAQGAEEQATAFIARLQGPHPVEAAVNARAAALAPGARVGSGRAPRAGLHALSRRPLGDACRRQERVSDRARSRLQGRGPGGAAGRRSRSPLRRGASRRRAGARPAGGRVVPGPLPLRGGARRNGARRPVARRGARSPGARVRSDRQLARPGGPKGVRGVSRDRAPALRAGSRSGSRPGKEFRTMRSRVLRVAPLLFGPGLTATRGILPAPSSWRWIDGLLGG